MKKVAEFLQKKGKLIETISFALGATIGIILSTKITSGAPVYKNLCANPTPFSKIENLVQVFKNVKTGEKYDIVGYVVYHDNKCTVIEPAVELNPNSPNVPDTKLVSLYKTLSNYFVVRNVQLPNYGPLEAKVENGTTIYIHGTKITAKPDKTENCKEFEYRGIKLYSCTW